MELKAKSDLFDKIGVELSQLHLVFYEGTDVNIYGSMVWKKDVPVSNKFRVQANMCDTGGKILYIISDFSRYAPAEINYQTFYAFCNKVSRFVNLDDLSYIELYPAQIDF